MTASAFRYGLVVAVMTATTAAADVPEAPATGDPPWFKDTTPETRSEANDLYDAGNELFAKQAHALALEKYRQALAIWDHPLIRFNAAVTEVRLDKVLEAADDLDSALRFGEQPFKGDLYQQALDYQRLLAGRLGYIEVSCSQPNTHLSLDGKPWLTCPGTKKVRVMAGDHEIVGERKSYLTVTKKLTVAGGTTATDRIELVPLESAIVLKYPFKKWLPWTTLGGGIGVALIGVGTYFAGKTQLDQFMSDYATECVNGCEPGLTSPSHALLRDEQNSAVFKGNLGIGLMAAGGAIAVGGTVFVLLNRPKRLLPGGLEVMPASGGGQVMYSVSF